MNITTENSYRKREMNLGQRIIQISGRKLTIDNAVVGIASYARFFAIPGLVAFSILLWYLKNRGKLKTRFRSH